MYTITLADGTKIKDLKLNGTNYVSKTEIDESVFENNLSTVTIYDGEMAEETVMHNMVFVQQKKYEDGWYIAFRERTEEELYRIEIDSKLEYLAMMMDVDL